MTAFRFCVTDTWELSEHDLYNLVGLLEEGKILPNTEAIVEGLPEREIFIKSVPIVHYIDEKRAPNEFILNIRKPTCKLSELKGAVLRNKQ